MRPASGGFPPRRKLARRPQDRVRRAGAFSPAPSRASGGGLLASPPSRASGGGLHASLPWRASGGGLCPSPTVPWIYSNPEFPQIPSKQLFYIYEKRKCSFTFKIEISLVITIEKTIFKRNHEMISRSLRSCW